MSEVLIKIVPREELYPKFGYAIPVGQTAYIREDLPFSVQLFVQDHELYHLRDKAEWWVWREVKANLISGIRHPIGFVACCILSLSPDRLKFYIKRFKEGR